MAADMAIKELIETIQKCMHDKGPTCDLNHLDISSFVSLDRLFCYELKDFNGDISGWDTSNVTSMREMFKGSSFNGDISRWNVSKVKDMHEMFALCHFKGDISDWDVGCLEYMSYMFLRTEYQGDLSRWNVSNVKNMAGLFGHSGYRGDLSNWNVSNVTNMAGMFQFSCVGDISRWDVSKVLDFTRFLDLGECQSDLGTWRINPLARVSAMMNAANFQGSFPRVPLRSDEGCVLPDTYFGDLASNYTLDEAKQLVSNKKWLDLYLKTTAPKGLGPLHMAKAVTLKAKPTWMSAADFKWAKHQHSICLGLGMEPRDSAKWMAQSLLDHKAGVALNNSNSIAFDFASLA